MESQVNTTDWWRSRRLTYNVALIIAGVVGFIIEAIGVERSRNPDAEMTLFTVAFQAVGYTVMMGVANLCYYLGPVSEKVLKPRNVYRYRRIAFLLGTGFSIALPLSLPVLLLIRG